MGYSELLVDRGHSIQDLANMCQQMFGGIDNLKSYQNAILLGVTKAPMYEDDEPLTRDTVRSFLLTQTNTPTAQLLANRLFLFDPLDRATSNQDFWSIERCRTEIDQLASIPQREATALFQTVLTDSDRAHLLESIRQLRGTLTHAITHVNEVTLSTHWQALNRLQVINHPEVDRLIIGEVVPAINNAISQRVEAFKDDAYRYNFDDAKRQLDTIKRIKSNLPGAPLSLDIDALNSCLERCRQSQGDEEAVKKEIANLGATVEAEKRRAEEAMRELQSNKEAMERAMANLRAELEEARQQQKNGFFEKLVGAVTGLVVGGPVGALIGYIGSDLR